MGGSVLLVDLDDRLLKIISLRPSAVVVTSELDAVEATYADLVGALAGLTATRASDP